MKKAFTLIELLVVVLIIGILASIALPQYTRAVEKARAVEAVSLISALEKSMDRYTLENDWRSSGNLLSEHQLDIDLPCEWNSEGACETKNFYYDAIMTGCASTGGCTGFTIVANRNAGTDYYVLGVHKESNGEVHRRCGCGGSCTATARAVCKGLEGQGWTFEEGYDY